MNCDNCNLVHEGCCQIAYTNDGLSYLHIESEESVQQIQSNNIGFETMKWKKGVGFTQ